MNYRRTKIVATFGPSTMSKSMIEKMIVAGVNVARINMSHYSKNFDIHNLVKNIKAISKRLNRSVSIIMDLPGPKIRTSNKEIISKVDRYNIGNQNLTSHAQNITTFSNTATNCAEVTPNMPKAAPSQQLVGQLSGKHTRERAVNCQRNNPGMVQAFNQNPYSQSLQSWA